MNRVRPRRMLFVMVAALTAGVSVGSCGGDDEGSRAPFDLEADVSRYSGPTPLATRFSASAKHATGDVIYRWRFDDGTTSEQQNPAHTFARAGYYTVILDARDEGGNEQRLTFLLGAWPPKEWAVAHWGFDDAMDGRADAVRRAQQRRTDSRHAAIRARVRERARNQTRRTPSAHTEGVGPA